MYIGCIVRVQVAPSHFESCVSYFSSWRLVLALSDWPAATDVDLPNHRQSPKRMHRTPFKCCLTHPLALSLGSPHSQGKTLALC